MIPEGVCKECLDEKKVTITVPCPACQEIPVTSTHWDRPKTEWADWDDLSDLEKKAMNLQVVDDERGLESDRLEAEDQRHADIGQGPDWNRE